MGRSVNFSSSVSTPPVDGSNGLVTVVGRDAFAKGDLVFHDYQISQFVNRNLAPVTEVCNTGGSTSSIIAQPVQAGTASSNSAVVNFPDGSYVLITSNSASATDTTHKISMLLYDKFGTVIYQNYRIAGASAPASGIYGLTACLITSTTFGIVFRTTGGVVAGWIVDSKLNIIVSPQLSALSGIVCMAPTSDGGFVASLTDGIYKVSITGSVTTITAGPLLYTGEDGTNGSDSVNYMTSSWTSQSIYFGKFGFFPISSSGYGHIYLNSTSLVYMRLNSDGTVRGTTNLVTGLTSVGRCVMALGASGNIFWAASHSGGVTWGIVADAATTVKASTLIASSDPNTANSSQYLRGIADANGDFLFTWASGTGTVLNQNYVTASAGTSKGAFPRSDAVSSSALTVGNRLFKLSTGIVHMFGSTTNDAYTVYSFINNAGTLVKDRIQPALVSTSGLKSVLVTGATVFNDALYAFQPSSTAVVDDPQGYLYSIDNTGTLSSVVAVVSNAVASDVMPVIYIDTNDIRVFTGPQIHRFRTSDKFYLGSHSHGFTTYPGSGNAAFRPIKVNQSFMLVSANSSFPWAVTGAPWPMAARGSGDKTVLVGVAQAASAAGGPVIVQTKGMTTSTYVTPLSSHADQTSNIPPGQNFSLTGGVAYLRGFINP